VHPGATDRSVNDRQPVVALRPVGADDCMRLYDWQQDPATRRFARNPSIPTPTEHREWFDRKLADPTCLFFIVQAGNDDVGFLRLDRRPDEAESAYEVSIGIAPAHHGRGYGRRALEEARKALPKAVFHACVLSGNEPSHALFRAAGYIQCQDEWYRSDPR